MRLKLLKIYVLFWLGLGGMIGLQAQESLNATGENASGSGGSVIYSVGQVLSSTDTGTNGSVTQGIQQPYEISVVTGIEEAKGINLSASAYPNPTTNYLTLNIYDFDISNLSYQLYNIQGELMQKEKITGVEIQIDMSNYVQSIYIIKVISTNQSIKEFKIIKQ